MRLKRLRKNRGLSAQQLAEQVGVTAKHIYALEGGRHTPSFRVLSRIAEALGVPLAWFFVAEGREQTAAVLEQYPNDLLDFLGRPGAEGYVHLASELAEAGASPDAVRALVADAMALASGARKQGEPK
jgi:transcriptional regulator with XRE-family HTH domain